MVLEGVGRTMTCWEATEFQLSRVYSIFVGQVDDPDAMRSGYGSGRIFQERIGNLRKAADAYFRRDPHQPLEGAFDSIAEAVVGFADRRNEVAHGIVLDVKKVSYIASCMGLTDKTRPHFVLIPPLYLLRKHTELGAPSYIYTSAALKRLAGLILGVERNVRIYRREFLKKLGLPQGPL
jgi:hypothetical protein